MAVSKRLRYEILRRDNHACRYCGATAPGATLNVDHVIPQALGGTDKPTNLVTACADCNSGKTSSTPDATLVADVATDALRWSAAIKQAAEHLREQEKPKLAYRSVFEDAWNDWTWEWKGEKKTFDLPAEWKTSIENFRQAGLPAEVWPDIVDKTMTAKSVRADNLFRYCCGIAWRMVRELHDTARAIVGATASPADVDSRKAVLETAFAVWYSGMSNDEDETPSAEQVEQFRRSLAELSDWDLTGEPGRIIEAAQHATYFDLSNITDALRDMDRSRIWSAWISAWPTTYVPGDTDEPWSGRHVGGPSDDVMDRVKQQINKLLDADAPMFRVVQAATHAGFHKSGRIYLGLDEDLLEKVGEHSWLARAAELWRSAFTAASDREPSAEETSQFFGNLRRIGEDGGFYIADVYTAASAAGSYQDPDVTTCLPRHLSVFEAAAIPLQPAS